jgi:hypothetical protein
MISIAFLVTLHLANKIKAEEYINYLENYNQNNILENYDGHEAPRKDDETLENSEKSSEDKEDIDEEEQFKVIENFDDNEDEEEEEEFEGDDEDSDGEKDENEDEPVENSENDNEGFANYMNFDKFMNTEHYKNNRKNKKEEECPEWMKYNAGDTKNKLYTTWTNNRGDRVGKVEIKNNTCVKASTQNQPLYKTHTKGRKKGRIAWGNAIQNKNTDLKLQFPKGQEGTEIRNDIINGHLCLKNQPEQLSKLKIYETALENAGVPLEKLSELNDGKLRKTVTDLVNSRNEYRNEFNDVVKNALTENYSNIINSFFNIIRFYSSFFTPRNVLYNFLLLFLSLVVPSIS